MTIAARVAVVWFALGVLAVIGHHAAHVYYRRFR